MNIGTLTAILGVDVSDLGRATTAMNSFAQRVRTVGYLASATLTAPIVAAGKAAFDVAKRYEYSMQTIVGLTGTAQSEVNQWSEEIRAMGKEFGKMPQELGEALYFIASSGIHGAEALEVLRVSAQAAASGLGETQKVADLVTSALNAYAGTGLTAGMVTDQLVAAVREGKAEADGFARSMGQVIPIAAELEVSFGEVAGGMAAITLSGASAANSAVWLKGIFNALLTASVEGQKALDSQNTSYEELRAILKERGLLALMDRLRELHVKMGDELFHDVLPNLRGLQGYLSIAGKNYEYNSQLIQRVVDSTGALGNAFEAISDTIKLRLDKALVTINESAIDFGKALAETVLPMIERLASWIERLVDKFEALTESQKRFRVILLLITAALGPLLLLLSTLTYAVSGLISVFRLLGTIFTKSVWGIIIVGIGALVGWLVSLKGKAEEAAKAHSILNKSLMDVKGTMKSISALSSGDYKEITTGEFLKKRAEANEAYVKAKAELKMAYERAGIPEEYYAPTGKAGPIRHRAIIKQRLQDVEKAKQLYDDLTQAYTKFASTGEKEAKVVNETTKAISDKSAALKELANINKWYLERYEKSITATTATPSSDTSFDYRKFFMRTGASGYGAGMKDFDKSLRTQMTLVTELVGVFESMFSNVENGFAGMARAAVQAIKKIATEILARMAVWAIFRMLFPQSAAFKEMGPFKSFAFARLGRGMAQGGIVPPGYPNDTYPARLSSGEAVIPKNLWQNLSPVAQNIHITVDGKISNRNLSLVLRRSSFSN